MKKTLIIFITILALSSFGVASSANAFIIPAVIYVAAATITVASSGFMYVVNKIDHESEETAQVQDQKEDQTINQGLNEIEVDGT